MTALGRAALSWALHLNQLYEVSAGVIKNSHVEGPCIHGLDDKLYTPPRQLLPLRIQILQLKRMRRDIVSKDGVSKRLRRRVIARFQQQLCSIRVFGRDDR